MSNNLIGVVLAGGKSSRMGRDKAMLPYLGSTLLAHQVAALSPLCSRVYVSGHYDGFDCIQDKLSEVGPLAGIHAAAMQFPESALLFMPVDMPLLDAALLSTLINGTEARHFYAQPLPAFFPDARAVTAVIEDLFMNAAGDFSIKHLQRKLLSSAFPAVLEAPFSNFNNPLDWNAFIAKSSE